MGTRDKVATLLSMDAARAFDTVSHLRLIHNLRKRKIPERIVTWVSSFLKNRSTTLAISKSNQTIYTKNRHTARSSSFSNFVLYFTVPTYHS